MTTDRAQDRFIAQMRKAITEGAIGRRDLIQQVVAMPAEEILELPCDVISALGAGGLSAVAKRHRQLADFAPKLSSSTDEEASSRCEARHGRPQNRWVIAMTLATAVFFAGVISDRERPWIATLFDTGVRTMSTGYWPTCRRLDGYVDGCLYRVASTGLSVPRATQLLNQPADDFLKVNPQLARADVIPPGTTLVVWRGILELKDQNK